MENRNNILMISFVAIAVLLSWGLTKDFNERQAPSANNVCKQDSLQVLVDSLRNEHESLLEEISLLEDGFDFKERRYEEILFEYEYGLDHLKNYYPESYKEFHRIIANKERFTRQTEKDNKQKLSPQNF
jgi:uncharacterized protein YlxW (UPF0749 family)